MLERLKQAINEGEEVEIDAHDAWFSGKPIKMDDTHLLLENENRHIYIVLDKINAISYKLKV